MNYRTKLNDKNVLVYDKDEFRELNINLKAMNIIRDIIGVEPLYKALAAKEDTITDLALSLMRNLVKNNRVHHENCIGGCDYETDFVIYLIELLMEQKSNTLVATGV